MPEALNYGTFGPVVGYGTAIVSAVTALSLIWQGRLANWRPPEEDMPSLAQKVVLVLCGVGMVIVWYYAEPKTVPALLLIGVALALLCFVSFLLYSGMIGRYLFVKQVTISRGKTRDVKILGGRALLPNAVQSMELNGITTVQDLFKKSAYDPDKLWSRESRQWVKTRVVALFIVVLLSGTLALTAIGFVTQVVLTGKPVATIARTFDATVQKEITNFIERLSEELQRFEASLKHNPEAAAKTNRITEIDNALILAVRHAQEEIQRFKAGRQLNSAEQSALNKAFDQLEVKRRSLESNSRVETSTENRTQKEEPHVTGPHTPSRGELNNPITVHVEGFDVSLEGIPSNIVILYNNLYGLEQKAFDEKFVHVKPVFLKTEIPIETNGGYIAFVGAGKKDMKICAEMVQMWLNEFRPGLGTSLPIKELQWNQLPPSPNGTKTDQTVWVYLP